MWAKAAKVISIIELVYCCGPILVGLSPPQHRYNILSSSSVHEGGLVSSSHYRMSIDPPLNHPIHPSPLSTPPPHPNLLNIHKVTNSSVSRTPFTQNNKLSLLLATCKTLLIETHSQSRSNELEKEHNKITSSHTADQNSLGGCLSHR